MYIVKANNIYNLRRSYVLGTVHTCVLLCVLRYSIPYIFNFILGLAKISFISELDYDHILVRK